MKLPSTAAIHPVFHLLQLKKMLGEYTTVQPTTKYITENHEWKAIPDVVYGYQKNKAGGLGSFTKLERIAKARGNVGDL